MTNNQTFSECQRAIEELSNAAKDVLRDGPIDDFLTPTEAIIIAYCCHPLRQTSCSLEYLTTYFESMVEPYYKGRVQLRDWIELNHWSKQHIMETRAFLRFVIRELEELNDMVFEDQFEFIE